MRSKTCLAFVLLTILALVRWEESPSGQRRAPIIDVHLHALSPTVFGQPPIVTCAPVREFLPRDPREPYVLSRAVRCDRELRSPVSEDAVMAETLAIMRRYSVTGVVSGPIGQVRRWKAAAPDSVIPALLTSGQVPLETIRALATDGTIRVLGELGFQHLGMAPDDAVAQAHFALAEELDLPVGVHMGPGAPGAPYGSLPKYEMRLSNPLSLEQTLVRHPRLRLYIMHAAWPMVDELIGVLYAHPQVYVDISLINWYLPRAEFHRHLRRLVEAGFAKRILFGSDQTVWPDALRLSIEAVESAEFLSPSQKRDIFYNNAARFLRLTGASQG